MLTQLSWFGTFTSVHAKASDLTLGSMGRNFQQRYNEKIADRNLTRAQMVLVAMVVVVERGGGGRRPPSTFLHITKNERIYRHQALHILSFINFTHHDKRNFPSL